jgi:hypothetical protein
MIPAITDLINKKEEIFKGRTDAKQLFDYQLIMLINLFKTKIMSITQTETKRLINFKIFA